MKLLQKMNSANNPKYIKNLLRKALLTLFFTCAIGVPLMSQSLSIQEEGNEYEKADAHLNEVYQKILDKYQEDKVFISKLREAQRIWILFRDAELEMKFPAENKEAEYGSVYSECASGYLIELTAMRSLKLQTWLDGIEEGEVCSGSVVTKDN